MEQNEYYQPEFEEEEIDWQKYITGLWKGRKLIVKVSIIFAILGVFFALIQTRKYTTVVTLAPELTRGNSSSLDGIASMLGLGSMNMGNNVDAYHVTMYPDVVESTPFLTGLFDIHVQDTAKVDTTLVGYLTREKGFSLMKFLGLAKKTTDQPIDLFVPSKKQDRVVKYLRSAINANVDKKTGLTTITVTTDNPFVSAIVADSVCHRLREYIINYRTSKARENLAYYEKLADESYAAFKEASDNYAHYQDHNRGLILNSVMVEGTRLHNELNIATQVYSQMKQQAEMARAKVQEEKPIFAVIQPAAVPLKPSNSRKTVVLIWMFLGFVGSSAWVLWGQEYLDKAKEMLNEAKK